MTTTTLRRPSNQLVWIFITSACALAAILIIGGAAYAISQSWPAVTPPQVPPARTADGQAFSPQSCDRCNTFGFVAKRGSQFVENTVYVVRRQADGSAIYDHPSPSVLRNGQGEQLTMVRGQDESGSYMDYVWYLKPGVHVERAIYEVGPDSNRIGYNADVSAVDPATYGGAVTMVHFRIPASLGELNNASFAAVTDGQPTP